MNPFSDTLRHLATRLPIPEPARSRVLLEMAADMEDSFQHYLEKGTQREEAIRTVEEQFDLSDAALMELVQLHASPFHRSLDGITRQARSSWERGILALVTLFVAPGLLAILLQPHLMTNASPLAFGLLAILALGLSVGGWKGWALFGPQGRRDGRRAARGLRSLPLLAGTSVLLGFSGIWIELYRTALIIRGEPRMALFHLVHWLQMASATLVISLSTALLVGLLWFFMESRAAHLRERAAATILEP